MIAMPRNAKIHILTLYNIMLYFIINDQERWLLCHNMKLHASLLWAGAALKACTVSAQALLYTSEAVQPAANGAPLSITQVTARLLLAQRLGLSRYHSLEDSDEITLEALNSFGVRQEPIFRLEQQTRPSQKLLVIVDGVHHPEGSSGFDEPKCYHIDSRLQIYSTLLQLPLFQYVILQQVLKMRS